MAAEKLGQKPGPKRSFEEMFEHASAFLSSASNIWKNPSAAAKKIVLKLAYTERLEYTRESGFRTPKTTLPFKVLRDFLSSESRMADREGVTFCCPSNALTCLTPLQASIDFADVFCRMSNRKKAGAV